MSTHAGPRITDTSFVLAYDASNQKSYDARENLVTTAGSSNYPIPGTDEFDYTPVGTYVLCRHNLAGQVSPFMNTRVDTVLNAGATYTISAWFKGGSAYAASFAYVGETVNEVRSTSISITTSWQRFTHTFTLTNAQSAGRVQLFFAAEGENKVVSIYGVQIQRGSSATDYVPTTGTPVFRSSTVVDLTTNARNGSITSAMTYTVSQKALTTNVTNATTSVPVTLSQVTFADASAYTFDFWGRLSGSIPNNTPTSLAGRQAANPWLGIQTTNQGSNNSWEVFFTGSNGVKYTFNNQNGANIRANWTNVVVSVATNRVCTLYVNGVSIGTITPATTQFFLSALMAGYSLSGTFNNWRGDFSSIRVYNKTLTAAEVGQNYVALRGRYGL